MPGWFERLTLGDPRKGDFRKEDLPDTRWRLFREVLKVRFWKMFGLNGLWLIFNVPMIILMLVGGSLVIDTMMSVDTQTLVSAEFLAQQLFPLINPILVLVLAASVLGGLGRVGMAGVIDTWAYDENEWTWDGFWLSIRKHWKQGLAVSLINALVLYLLFNAVFFYFVNSSVEPFMIWLSVFCLALALIWWMMNQYFHPLMTNYKIRLRYVFRNAFVLACGRLPQSLLCVLCRLAVPTLMLLLFGNYGMIALFVYYSLIGASLPQLISSSVAHAVFDRHLNPKIPGALVNRGLQSQWVVGGKAVAGEQTAAMRKKNKNNKNGHKA